MARHERFRISHTRAAEATFRSMTEAYQAGVLMGTAAGPNGRTVNLNGQTMLNFGSCGYMSLETRAELRQGAHDAINVYGTQFSFSRVLLQCPLYLELESALEQITGRPAVVGASTSLVHQAALPLLIQDGDSIIIDQFAHASLHTALKLLPSVPMEIVRHNRMDLLEEMLVRLGKTSRHVWYVADGLYSMLGDFAPFEQLKALLERYPQLRLYFDDAHSTTCLGQRGRGLALDHFMSDERVVVALSLNKAFAAAGGMLSLPSESLKALVRRAGGPMLFSGPIPPPMLGAALASARLHLDENFSDLQQELRSKLELCGQLLGEAGLDIPMDVRSPIFHVQFDSPRLAYGTVNRLKERGYYCCAVMFPAVPVNRPGIRFTVCRHNAAEDIREFIFALTRTRAEMLAKLERSPKPASILQTTAQDATEFEEPAPEATAS